MIKSYILFDENRKQKSWTHDDPTEHADLGTWYAAPEDFRPEIDLCELINGQACILSDAERMPLEEAKMPEVFKCRTFAEALQTAKQYESDLIVSERVKVFLQRILKVEKAAFYKTGFGFICLAKPDEILVFDSDKKSGKSIQSRVELRKDVLELQARPEKVTMQDNIRILMAHEEFVFFYQQLSYFISVVEDAFGDARESVLKTITVKDLLDIPAPDYNKAVEVIPRTFIPKATIWERRDKYVNNIRIVRWLNSGWFSKRFGDGYPTDTDPEVDKEQI